MINALLKISAFFLGFLLCYELSLLAKRLNLFSLLGGGKPKSVITFV